MVRNASIVLSDRGELSHCDIWEIFFPSEQVNKKRCRDDSPRQNMEGHAERAQRDPENCKAMQMEGKPLLANGQKAISRRHRKEASSIFNLVDQAFIVHQS